MSLEVNKSSIKLGDTSNSVKPIYTSEYLPVYSNPADIPAFCKITPDIPKPFELGKLSDLNTLCKFAFPPVFLTPPIYNEPPIIPEACESFTATISVEFNHPIKEFFFVVQRDEMINTNEWFNYSNLAQGQVAPQFVIDYMNTNAPGNRMDLISLAKLQLDGYDRFMDRVPEYFRLEQPYEHHTTTPVNSFIYNY